MSIEYAESHSSKKRRSHLDLSADEMATAPSRKVSKLDATEEVSQELVHAESQVSPLKKPSRSVREAKKLHKERVRDRNDEFPHAPNRLAVFGLVIVPCGLKMPSCYQANHFAFRLLSQCVQCVMDVLQ